MVKNVLVYDDFLNYGWLSTNSFFCPLARKFSFILAGPFFLGQRDKSQSVCKLLYISVVSRIPQQGTYQLLQVKLLAELPQWLHLVDECAVFRRVGG